MKERVIDSIVSNGHPPVNLGEFVLITLFPDAEIAKDGAKFTQLAPIPRSACCPEGALKGHVRISKEKLFPKKI